MRKKVMEKRVKEQGKIKKNRQLTQQKRNTRNIKRGNPKLE